ncbi:MAG TPA: lysophospholipid acyltransferase family protein [Opitutaceae bacterium]
MSRIARLYFTTLYYLSWLIFAVVGLGLNALCLVLLLFPHRKARAAGVRALIRGCFDLWLRWLHATRVVSVEWRGFDGPLPRGTVYIANHPTLVDATFLLARLPDAVCIFKPALMRNPAIGPAAIMAGYTAGDTGIDLIRETAAKIAAGQSLLIFPEGTRTGPGEILGPLRPGFALIASRAAAPVQLVVIRSTPELAARGRPWWKPPAILPGRVELTLDHRWEHDPARHATELTAEVEQRLSAVLAPSS